MGVSVSQGKQWICWHPCHAGAERVPSKVCLPFCHVTYQISVLTFVTSVYVTVSLNKLQIDKREHGQVPSYSTVELHIPALREMLSRRLSQRKFIMHVSGAFPINSGRKQNRSPKVYQQCGAFFFFFAVSATPAHYLSQVVKRSRCSCVGHSSVSSAYPQK